MATPTFNENITPDDNVRALLQEQKLTGATAAMPNGWQPFDVLIAKTAFNAEQKVSGSIGVSALGFINVKNSPYGAKGDGTTDDTLAIQAALDATFAAGGGTVFVPASTGAYMISNRLLIDSGVTLEMESAATIRSTSTAQVCMLRNRNMLLDAPYTDTNITVRGGTWDYNYRGGNTAYAPTDKVSPLLGARGTMSFIGVTNLIVENVRVYDSGGFGIQIMGSYWRAENIFFDRCYKDGMHISKSDNFVIRGIRADTLGDDVVALNAMDWTTSTPKAGPITFGLVEGITSINNPNRTTVKFLAGATNASYVQHIVVRDVKSDGPVIFNMTQDLDLETPGHTYGGLGIVEDISISGVKAETYAYVILGNDIRSVSIDGLSAKSQSSNLFNQQGTNPQGNVCSTQYLRATGVVLNPLTSAVSLLLSSSGSTMTDVVFTDWLIKQAGGSTSVLGNIVGTVTNLSIRGLDFLSSVALTSHIVQVSGTLTNLDISDCNIKTVGTAFAVASTVSSGTIVNAIIGNSVIYGLDRVVNTQSVTPAINVVFTGNVVNGNVTCFYFQCPASLTISGNSFSGITSTIVRCANAASNVIVKSSGNLSVGGSGSTMVKDAGTIRWIGHDMPVTKASITPATWDTIFSTTAGDGVQIYNGSSWQKWGHGYLSSADIATTADIKAATIGKLIDADGARSSDQIISANLDKARAAIAKLRTGAKTNVKIVALGDSNTAGFGSTGAATYANCKALSYPSQLVASLTAAGYSARNSSWLSGNTGGAFAGYDPRLSIGAGWVETYQYLCFFNNTTTNALAFTATERFDTIEVMYVNGSGGVFTIDVDGGAALATITANGASTISKQTISCPLGVHTLNAKRVSGSCFVVSMIAYDSTAPNISVINVGIGGYTSGNFNDGSATWGPLITLGTLAPDLTLINIGINDVVANVPAATYQTNLDAIVVKALLSGSVIIAAPIPFTTANRPALWASYITAMKTVAANRGAIFVDSDARYTSYANAVSLGFNYDTLHPNGAGYSDFAGMVEGVILPFIGTPLTSLEKAVLATVQTVTPTTGQTVSMTDNAVDNTLYLTPAGTLAALTVNLPSNANSRIGQVERIFTTQQITALTVANATTILGNPTTLNVNESVSFQKMAANTWAAVVSP